MRKKKNMFQTKKQDKTQEKRLNEMDITNLLNKEFKLSHKNAHCTEEKN